MRYIALDTPGGYCVARVRFDGVGTVESHHTTWESATAKADRMNASVRAADMLQRLRAAAHAATHATAPRRAVRYFEPDAFA